MHKQTVTVKSELSWYVNNLHMRLHHWKFMLATNKHVDETSPRMILSRSRSSPPWGILMISSISLSPLRPRQSCRVSWTWWQLLRLTQMKMIFGLALAAMVLFSLSIFTLISLRTSVDQLPFPESGKTNVFWNLKGYAGCFQSANLTQGTLWKEKVATGVEGSLVYFALRILGRPVNTSSSDAPLAWNARIPLTLLFRGAPLTIYVGAFNLKRRSPASRKFLSPPAGTFGSKEMALFLTRFCLPKELGSKTSRLSSFVRVLDSPLLPNLIC